MRNLALHTTIIIIAFAKATIAQMPQTDIYLMDYEGSGSSIKILNLKRVSKGSDYNNQPFILPGCESIIYTSNSNDSTQTDILEYEISTGITKRKTNDSLSEYSPKIRPQSDDLSIVRVESDLKQHLRQIHAKTKESVNLVPASDSIGYYAWSGPNHLGLIVLNKGLEFHTYQIGDTSTQLVSDSVGRFIASDNKGSIFWFHSKKVKTPALVAYDFAKKSVVQIVPILPGCDDYGFDKMGSLFGGKDGVLYQFQGGEWKSIADLNTTIGRFYRMHFCDCGRHLCLVGFTGKKP